MQGRSEEPVRSVPSLTVVVVLFRGCLAVPDLYELSGGDEPVALVVPGQGGRDAGAVQPGRLHPPVVQALR